MSLYNKLMRTAKIALFVGGTLLGQTTVLAKTIDVEKAAKALPSFINKLTNEMQILPGVSVAIVHRGKVVLEQGWGVTDIRTGKVFTKDTQTYIASGTKAFLGLVVAQLADKGEIDLNAPIGVTYLSDMDQENLGAFATLSFNQLLTHTHGLNGFPIGFRTAYTGDMNIADFWRVVGKMKPAKEGKAFTYSNFGYVAAGYVLEHIYKENWQTLVQRHVLRPLGMDQSTAKISDMMKKDIAMPHIWHGKTRRIPLYKRDASMHAAGGHYASAADMARWLTLNINEGKLDKKQVIPASAVRKIQAPLVPLDKTFYKYKRYAHGFGWYHSDYKGERLLHHFGSFSGYRSHISFMPESKIGVVVLSNDLSRPSFNLPDMIANYVYDLALGKENVASEYGEELAILGKLIAPIKGKDMPIRPTNAPDDIAAYSGIFTNDVWGSVIFSIVDGKLNMQWGQASYAPVWTVRKGVTYLRFEIAGLGYLMKPVMDEAGLMTHFEFEDAFFTRR